MATKTIYITVRLDIDNDKVDNIADDDIQEIVDDLKCKFDDVGDYVIEPIICGINE